jgi:hypothetical protein
MTPRRKARPIEHDDEIDEQEDKPTTPQPELSLTDFLSETFGHTEVDNIGPSPEEILPEGQLPSIAWVKKNFKTKSAAIRYLVSKGHEVKDIANLLSVKYQHVRNVKVTQLKRGPNEDWNLTRKNGEPNNGKGS